MNIAILDRYTLADDFEQRAIDLNFPAGVWNVAAELAEVSEATSSFELEKLTGQSSDQVQEALKRLLAKKLVRQNLMTWKDFTATKERDRSAAAKAAAVAVTAPSKQVVPTLEMAVKPAQEGVALRLGTILPHQAAVGTTNAWVRQKPEPVQMAASKPVTPAALLNDQPPKGRLLRPMLAQIENLKGGGVEGQLLVYQVFLRVPYQLLHDEGIKSLHFVDERTVIQNPVLHAAIVKAAKDVTGIELT